MAPTGSDHHVTVLLQDDVGAVVEVEHGDAVELSGGAAGLRNRVRVYEVHLEEKSGLMICEVQCLGFILLSDL